MGNRPIINIKPYNPNWYPPCYESETQYKEYMHAMIMAGSPTDANNYCMDCTREYKIQMIQEKKCEHKETIFVIWRTPYKLAIAEGTVHTTNEPDVIGISNISCFWGSPLYD
jgi:hypothetical protein